jgi:hypothetical protein
MASPIAINLMKEASEESTSFELPFRDTQPDELLTSMISSFKSEISFYRSALATAENLVINYKQ